MLAPLERYTHVPGLLRGVASMTIKGLDALRQHVPELNTPLGILWLLFWPIVLCLLVNVFFMIESHAWPFWSLVGEIALGGLGFGWLNQFFRLKDDFEARFGPLAYSQAARRFGLPAVTLIATAVAHLRTLPGPAIPDGWWSIVLPVSGWGLIAAGTLLALRVVQAFGVDNLTMLYVYFPEESRLVSHKIYTVLRHPAYAAVQCLSFGLALLNGNWFALVGALSFALGLWGWVRLVEERELTERFGPAYATYRQQVPAFWPRLRDLKRLFEFLILGG